MGLLKNVPPLLTADLLHVLRSMGHGDTLVLCDCNFPAAEVATKTTSGKHIQLSVDLPTALDSICTLLPLDFFEEYQAKIMAPQNGITSKPPTGEEVEAEAFNTIQRHCYGAKCGHIERFEFYDKARACFAVVQTLERRPYGNVILYKGVLDPAGKDMKP
uniref:L-fucose mutarotase n=1 Tax=Aplanochytrium stocchinoi TaxID=215587 RepID=A0A7S3LRY9_9STRA|mmetsp:Transcript_16558/g.18727  ORF Transcript_16558/g.18727 Transcript_16558/m.18727 type:complete len:160 (+) Transcript_16558:77-556(+)